MSKTLHFFVGHLFPRRNKRFYREYLDETGAINRARKLGADAQRRHVTTKHWVVIVFLLTQSCHQLWLVRAYPGKLTNRQLLLHYDAPALEFGSVMFNVTWGVLGPLCAIMWYNFFLRSDDRIIALLDAILFRRQCSLFAALLFCRTTPYEFLRKCSIVIATFSQSFIIFLNIILAYWHFHIINRSFTLLNVSFDDSPLDSLLYRVNAFKYHAFMYEFGQILILAGTIAALIVCCNYVTLKLANQVLLLRGHRRKSLSHDWRRFDRFRRYFIGALRHFSYANAWIGASFTAFLAVNFPLNAYLVMFLLNADLPSTAKLHPLVLVVVQVVACLGLHLAFSKFCSLIHRPCKPLMSLMLRQHFRPKKIGRIKKTIKRRPQADDFLRDQIRLSLFIGAFNTANRYGHTYGKYGLVTMATFTKCLMFYGKFMMISYKNIRKNLQQQE